MTQIRPEAASQHSMRTEELWGANRSVKPAWNKEGNMVLHAVVVRDRVIQRVTQQYNGVDNKRLFLIEADSAKPAWAKAGHALGPRVGSADCICCRHRHCSACEECSVTKQYSDYWICHCCGELNRRFPNLY